MLNRREFLGSLAFAAWQARAAGAKKVVIAGAGLAGLSCGYELRKRGYDVLVLEGRARPGGRVETFREGLAPGLTAETGATRIPDTHDLTLAYVKEFGLTLEPFKSEGLADVYHLRGKTYKLGEGPGPEWPVALRPEERRLGLNGMAERYLLPPLLRSRNSAKSRHVPPPIAAFDRSTLHQYLSAQGLSQGAIELMSLGFGANINAAHALLIEFNGRSATGMYHIRGGNDQLPNALAERLAGQVRYGWRVEAIGQNDASAWVTAERGGERTTFRGDYVVSALPFSMARGLFPQARLSPEKQRVLREQKYYPVDKIFLQMREQFWRKQGLSGFANTDLVSERFWALGGGAPESRGLLLSYVIGPNADKLDAMDEAGRIRTTIDDAERVFPGARANCEGGRAKSWQRDPWQNGGLARFDPGEIGFISISAQAEGRIHFAGEHTSRWTGWMQGALESARRVLSEIADRDGAAQ